MLRATSTQSCNCSPSDRLLTGSPFMRGMPSLTVKPLTGIVAVLSISPGSSLASSILLVSALECSSSVSSSSCIDFIRLYSLRCFFISSAVLTSACIADMSTSCLPVYSSATLMSLSSFATFSLYSLSKILVLSAILSESELSLSSAALISAFLRSISLVSCSRSAAIADFRLLTAISISA